MDFSDMFMPAGTNPGSLRAHLLRCPSLATRWEHKQQWYIKRNVFVYTYMYMCMSMCMYMSMSMYMCMCMYVCVCSIYIYMYT